MGKLFGTDGVRGVAGEGNLTPEHVVRLGRALGRSIHNAPANGKASVLIGHDSRESGPALEASLTAGLLSSGVDVVSGGMLPTPAVQRLTRQGCYDLGIIVSASHNPFHDNGIKVVGGDGEKLDDDLESRIEAEFAGITSDEAATEFGERRIDESATTRSIEALTEESFSGLDLEKRTIVLDTANGAASNIAPIVLERLGATVITIHNQPDGRNINDHCGALHPEVVQETCRSTGPCIGITLDGDADRALLVDEAGEIRDGDHILGLLGLFYKSQNRLTHDTVVATVMSNIGLERTLAGEGITLLRTPVGDRHVVQRMKQGGYRLGGEQSGHILSNDGDGLFGDGLATALNVLAVVQETGKTLSELASVVPRFPQLIVNVAVRDKPVLEEIETVAEAVRETESELGDSGRVVLRYSGTEPLARVMLEGPDQPTVERLAEKIADAIRNELGK